MELPFIPNLLNEEECQQMNNGMWDTLEHLTKSWAAPIRRNNPKSWKQIEQFKPLHSMLIQSWSIGHAQYLWNLRQNPKLVEVFATLWDCLPAELLVSFDAVSYCMSPEETGFGWYEGTDNLHVDQSFLDSSFKCIQSWVTADAVEDGDATLTLLEGSHLHHQAFQDKFQKGNPGNFYALQQEERAFFEQQCPQVRIACPKGSMVLWDSRTVHCGANPIRGRSNPKVRNVAYVCYLPRYLSTYSDRQKKIDAFRKMQTTSHWPCTVKVFPDIPRRAWKEGGPPVINPLPNPVVNGLGRQLIGFDDEIEE